MTKKSKGGVPKTVLNKKQVEKVKELAGSHTTKQIARYLGIGDTTFFEIKKRQPEVAEAYKLGRTRSLEFVASKLWEHINEGNLGAIIFWLKTQGKWGVIEKEESNFQLTTSKDPIKIIDSALEGVSKGHLSSQSAVQIASIAMTRANMASNLETTEDHVNTPTDWSNLGEKVKAFAKVIDHIEDKK